MRFPSQSGQVTLSWLCISRRLPSFTVPSPLQEGQTIMSDVVSLYSIAFGLWFKRCKVFDKSKFGMII